MWLAALPLNLKVHLAKTGCGTKLVMQYHMCHQVVQQSISLCLSNLLDIVVLFADKVVHEAVV